MKVNQLITSWLLRRESHERSIIHLVIEVILACTEVEVVDVLEVVLSTEAAGRGLLG